MRLTASRMCSSASRALNNGPIKNEAVEAIYREIMSASLDLEKPLRIAYMGPEATFSHLASLKKFGSSVGHVACDNVAEVFSKVESGDCDYGVVPIENSIEGVVTHTMDLLVDSDLKDLFPGFIGCDASFDVQGSIIADQRSLFPSADLGPMPSVAYEEYA